MYKELLHIFRDPRTLLFLFGIPLVQVLLFGFVLSNDIENVKVAVLDRSRDAGTREIVERLHSSGFFVFAGYLDNEEQIGETFRRGDAREVIVFGPDFTSSLHNGKGAELQLILDASEPNTASLISSYTQGIIQDYLAEEMGTDVQGLLQAEIRMEFNPALRGVYMFVPGIVAMILILISALMTSVSITREKEYGSMEVLLVSPLKPVQIILGKVTPYILIAFADALFVLLLGFFVFGMPMHGNLILLLALSLLYILMALALGILISTLSNSQQVAMFISMFALMLPTILLSGFIFPIENMPRVLQWISYIMPPRYFIIIMKDIMVKGVGFLYVWKETAFLAGATLLFLGISIKRFSLRLE
jgi:ABC-2 type transport system permease protein